MTSESSMTFSDECFSGGLPDPLHSYGLQKQLDLPQIAVIGSRSVGKSSLIESISGITLPRARGTCTRCPIECRLARSTSSWSCEVYLRVERQSTEIQFGSLITDKSGVEDRIRRAQLAILNPSREPAEFLGPLGDVGNAIRNEDSFSSDLVSVRISSREMNDLSFVDLPGIIASMRDGGVESDIDEVKNLVRNVIQRPSCLILLVISCDNDIENQGARRLAKEVDSMGHRTIPVLTKPDRIAIGEHSHWLSLLSNGEEHYRHGWHCVKQPNQQQLESHISWQDARANEVEFFAQTEPWNSLGNNLRSRLGAEVLTEALGRILFPPIVKRSATGSPNGGGGIATPLVLQFAPE